MIVRKKRFRRVLFWVLTAVLVLVLILLLTCFMLVYRPRDYRPCPLTKALQKNIESEMMSRSDTYMNEMALPERFTLSFTQDLLNGVLLHEDYEYYMRKSIQSAMDLFEQPQVRLSEDCIEVMGRVSYEGRSVILTIGLRVIMTDAGKIELKMLPVKIGAVPLPEKLIRQYLDRAADVLDKGMENVQSSAEAEISNSLKHKLVPVLHDLINKQEVLWEPEYRAFEDYWVRITDFKIRENVVELEFEPLGKRK